MHVHKFLLCDLVHGTLPASTALKLLQSLIRTSIQFLVRTSTFLRVITPHSFFFTVRKATFMRTEILVIRQWAVVISYRRIGPTYRSHFQGSKIQKERRQPCYESKKKAGNPSTGYIIWSPAFFLDYWPLKMVPIGCPETSVKKSLLPSA
jgi:hypothetical protein